MNEMIAFCGLDCEKCATYIATANNDDSLRVKTAQEWSEMYNAPINPEDINCDGCRGDGVKLIYCEKYCEIRKCAIKKNLITCGKCKEMDSCQKVGAIIEHNSEAMKNLQAMSMAYTQT